MRDTRIFVSYSRRDGVVTKSLLARLSRSLSAVCQPFVHALDETSPCFPQIRVVGKLLGAHALLLIDSPNVRDSPWVRFELLVARLKMMPILSIPVTKLPNTTLPADRPSAGG